MLPPGTSRNQIARTLNTAYADGLLSEDTFSLRLEQLFTGSVIDSSRLIGDLTLTSPPPVLAAVVRRGGRRGRRHDHGSLAPQS